MALDRLLKTAGEKARAGIILADDAVSAFLPKNLLYQLCTTLLERDYLCHIPGNTVAFNCPEMFDYLLNAALPAVYDSNGPEIGIWSAGCSTGEEAFSLAMVALEYMERTPDAHIRITATDLNENRIIMARTGLFSSVRNLQCINKGTETVIREDPKWNILKKYSSERARIRYPEGNLYRMEANPEVVGLCTFEVGDLITSPKEADIVVVSNVIKHMNLADRRAARRSLESAVKPDGYLLVHDRTHPKFNLHLESDTTFLAYRKLQGSKDIDAVQAK
ncbi:hypothetical protein HYU11_02155 [Candidatus Woesearchaeota archaeon]|nr:hypothetical protein [Candidatus Woesearchaeota archaeon]